MKRFRPQKPDWYEELFATAMDTSMKPYEAEVTTYKSQLFAELKGKASEVLELGIGTGPNLKYYAGAGLHVIGVDPNAKMEKYAKAAATAAGLQVANFDFRQAVGEALPLANASVDAVVGTLVLCSVGDVNRTLSEVMRVLKPGGLYLFVEHVAAKDGTFLRIIQTLLDPLQEALADGCHLTQNTGQSISQAGFSKVDINSIFVSSASLLGPHVGFGIRYEEIREKLRSLDGYRIDQSESSFGGKVAQVLLQLESSFLCRNDKFALNSLCLKEISKKVRTLMKIRPHGSNATSQEWSVGRQEPYWQTNTSFSPPPVRREFRHQSGGLVYGSLDGNQQHGSSTSSDSRGSRSWVRGIRVPCHQSSASDHAGLYFSSPSDMFQAPQWTPPIMKGINMDEYEVPSRALTSRPFFVTPTMEGTSVNPDSGGSTSSRSDGSEYELAAKSQIYNHHNFSGRRSFMSKPIHPVSFLSQTSTRGPADPSALGFPEFDSATPQREGHRHSSGSSSVDFTDASESFDSEVSGRFNVNSESFKCAICERFLSQRSPWSSRRIVRNGDMPIASVLSCRHVFHAECLERETLKASKSDPPCPLCAKPDDGNSPKQHITFKVKSNFPRLKSCNEDGLSSRPWDCGHSGDCVEGALQAPPRNAMVILNRNRMKSFSSKGSTSSKEFPGKPKKTNVSHPLQLFSSWSSDQGSKSLAGPSTRR
ncbi:hypothetical protein QQ045_020820 [Rhodiola kirilowii]